jgi:hypothetical protein
MTAPPTIFVQIPAYLDRELPHTLRDLYRKAAYPEALRTVVFWQRDPGDELPSDVLALPQLTVIQSDAAVSRGPNWARFRLQSELADEPYSLLLDSHHRFARDWDRMIVEMHDGLVARGVRKPIVSSYLPAYIPGVGRRSRQNDPYIVSPLERENGVLTRLTSHPLYKWENLRQPVRGTYVSLHFLFASSEFVREVPIDPHIYFFGDETALSVRAFTHGWDVYHPHRILGWHAYSRATREPHWNRHADWHRANQRSIDRQRSLYTGGDDTAELRGSERSVADFEAHALHRLVAA